MQWWWLWSGWCSFLTKTCAPGIQLHDVKTCDDKLQYISALSFFKQFFTHELIDMICLFNNRYAAATGHHKPLLFKGWIVLHQMRCITTSVSCFTWLLLIYPDWICIEVQQYCFMARSFISSMKRFKHIRGFLEVSNIYNKDKTDKISKVWFLHEG